jgi:hypothetical protein
MSNSEIKQLAKHHLELLLRKAGVEFDASPRERGIDLIAVLRPGGDFVRSGKCKIKIGANEKDRFGVLRKWEESVDLLVYAWNVTETSADVYALSYDEAVALLEERGHTRSPSWTQANGGFTLDVGNAEKRTWWTNRLSRYRMDSQKLKGKIYSVCNSRSLNRTNRATMEA